MKVRSFVHLISPFLSSTATPPLFTVSALSTLFLRTESVSVTQVNQIIKKYVLKLSIVLSYCVVRQHPAEIVELPNEMNLVIESSYVGFQEISQHLCGNIYMYLPKNSIGVMKKCLSLVPLYAFSG